MASKKRKRIQKPASGLPRTPPTTTAVNPVVGQSSPSWLKTCGGAAFIVAIALLAHWPAVDKGELLWDDETWIGHDATTGTRHLIQDPQGIFRIWVPGQAKDYWPLTNSAFWIQWRLWRMDPAGYRVVNILLHALGCILIWAVLRKLSVPGAWLGALLFAIHPLTVASVAWISELKNCLSLPFYAAALLAWLYFESSGRWQWYAVSLSAFLLALFAKTSTVVLPVVLLGMAWWLRGRISRRDVLRSVPFFLLSLGMGLSTVWAQVELAREFGQETLRPEGFLSRLAASGWVVWFYLYKALLPVRLSMIYPRWHVNPGHVVAWLPLAGLVGVLAIAWWGRRTWGRPILAALGYFMVTLGPVLGLLGMSFHVHSLVSDHFVYLSLPAITAVAGAGLALAADWKRLRPWVVGVAGMVIITLALMTWERSTVFRTQETLWADTLAKNPDSFMAYFQWGDVLVGAKRFHAATAYYERATQLNPNSVEAYNNWGACLQLLGDQREALKRYAEVLRLQPSRVRAHLNSAMALQELERYEEAILHYEAALKIVPNNPEAHNNWGRCLVALDRLEDAAAQFRYALKLQPDNKAARGHLHQVEAELRRRKAALSS